MQENPTSSRVYDVRPRAESVCMMAMAEHDRISRRSI
uniref:Uncharacterized protein n=1 Tax=Triticum urartu TaxID=4572 RepID=A0A8R7Q2Q6_TRIUA